jgi:genome maintenance exonuclease 1
MILQNNKFNYLTLTRFNEEHTGQRKYNIPDSNPVPSVTTILGATQSIEKKAGLANWRNRIGKDNAQSITNEAASRGTRMHSYLEKFILNGELPDCGSNPYAKQSHKMASVVSTHYLKPHITEFYGTEVGLYYPDVYAGTTDLIAEWDSEISIIDFKQTNKPKKKEYITDYFLQLAAYSLAHNYLYETKINQGVVLMCSVDYEPQHWIINGNDMQYYQQEWCKRVEQYYSL